MTKMWRQTNKLKQCKPFYILCRLPIDMWTAIHAKRQFPSCSKSLIEIDQVWVVGLYLNMGLCLPWSWLRGMMLAIMFSLWSIIGPCVDFLLLPYACCLMLPVQCAASVGQCSLETHAHHNRSMPTQTSASRAAPHACLMWYQMW